MRKQLALRHGERLSFTATFERFGRKSGWKGAVVKTALFRDVRLQAGLTLTDHLWFNFTKGFAALGLKPGDRVSFDARVTAYRKGHARDIAGMRWDYRLSNPTKAARASKRASEASVIAE